MQRVGNMKRAWVVLHKICTQFYRKEEIKYLSYHLHLVQPGIKEHQDFVKVQTVLVKFTPGVLLG